MGATTKIEWTGSTWSPIRARNLETGKIGWHCVHASTGCKHCYAEGINKRLGTGMPFNVLSQPKAEIFLDEKMLALPLRWKQPRMVFVCSMTDLFADFVTDDMIDRIFAVMALCPQHTFQVLTKRAYRMVNYMCAADCSLRFNEIRKLMALMSSRVKPECDWPLPNVWLGVSVENQQYADERIPLLLETPAAVRWVSYEPMLGPMTFRWAKWQPMKPPGQWTNHLDGLRRIDWIVCGYESGPKARSADENWVRSVRDECTEAGVSFFYKQRAVNGRKISLPRLDGQQWAQFPGGAR